MAPSIHESIDPLFDQIPAPVLCEVSEAMDLKPLQIVEVIELAHSLPLLKFDKPSRFRLWFRVGLCKRPGWRQLPVRLWKLPGTTFITRRVERGGSRPTP